MAEENKKGKTITDDQGDEFTFDQTAESTEDDLEVLDVTNEEEKKSGTVTDQERQASFEMD
ncbi:hypothetical protein HUW51_13650 [Adhaeribacter swui]|uniref:Uncharacterized protein n=1 Tax=Adhaeribacter swui TaxID=2086471 RepID=A0A7G7G979_9BACT|nr:hypothetical protein [Adhaeribacter swui]QNF33713.1 hypothetical protein HUW51_13650 [Adhaeribacter swui]